MLTQEALPSTKKARLRQPLLPWHREWLISPIIPRLLGIGGADLFALRPFASGVWYLEKGV